MVWLSDDLLNKQPALWIPEYVGHRAVVPWVTSWWYTEKGPGPEASGHHLQTTGPEKVLKAFGVHVC